MISGSTPISGNTAFHYYDNEIGFVSDCINMYTYIKAKLGGNPGNLGVELVDRDIIISFEESVLEYSGMVNSYQAKSIITSILGMPQTLQGLESKLPRITLDFQKKMAEPYAPEVGVGGKYTLHSGSIDLLRGVQRYDLNVLHSGNVPTGQEMQIERVFHFNPVSAYRFFDTTSAINYLNNQFRFESFTPETIFYLLPIWEDVLRAQSLQMSARVRRSNYSYMLNNNVLTIYPMPTSTRKLYFTYYLMPQNTAAVIAGLPDAVTNSANAPFGNISYEKINSIGRQWIRRFCLALCKELLGLIRGKVQSIPIPNAEIMLNHDILISTGREDQDKLREELKLYLDEMTYDKISLREAEKAEALQRELSKVPLLIYKY